MIGVILGSACNPDFVTFKPMPFAPCHPCRVARKGRHFSWALAGLLTLLPAVAEETAAESGSGMLDRFRSSFAHTLGGSARWVDGFFAPDRNHAASEGASGRLSARAVWQEYEGINFRTRLRADLPLDNISHRLNAFVGKGDADEIVENNHNQSSSLNVSGKDTDWLVGLGYTPPWSRSKRFTLSAGVVVTWPPDPYARLNYRFSHQLSETVVLNFNEGVFWKESEAFGLTSSLDADWRLSDSNLVRWLNWAKVSGTTTGAEFDSRIQLYHNLRSDRAILYGLGFQGDTGEAVPVRQYGVYAIYRQRLFRDWFAGELIAGATMLRENGWTERRFSTLFGIGFELAFEEKPAPPRDTVATRLLRRGH